MARFKITLSCPDTQVPPVSDIIEYVEKDGIKQAYNFAKREAEDLFGFLGGVAIKVEELV